MNKIFITSDLHLNHANIITYCNRPFASVEQMDFAIINKWNTTVKKDDIVIVLGDIGFGNKNKMTELISQLNGHKRLIMGNHDNFKPIDYTSMGFEWVSPFPIIWQGKYILSHIPLDHVPTGYINLYGHIHTNQLFPTYCKDGICVCCDRFDFIPQTFQDLLKNQKQNSKNTEFLSSYKALDAIDEYKEEDPKEDETR